jgi:hypothetical protein
MRILHNLKIAAILLVIFTAAAQAQDISINVISQEKSTNDGDWPLDAPATTTAILVTICNEDGGTTALASYKIRPLISVPGTLVQYLASGQQTGLPAGWTVLSNTGAAIRLSNGTDQISAGECRDIVLYASPVAQGGPGGITATLAWSNGAAPGSGSGPQTTGNLTANDNSTTAVSVGAPLPVTLVSFKATRESQTALLNWATTEETNSNYFEVQRSGNGKSWLPVGTVSSHGESKVLRRYTFTDGTPMTGQNYYRLKMVDKDNTFAYSSIENLDFGQGIAMLYPNPTSDQLTLRAEDVASITRVEIIGQDGKVLYDQQRNAGNIRDKIDVKNFRSGIYVVRLTRKDHTVASVKIVKD